MHRAREHMSIFEVNIWREVSIVIEIIKFVLQI